MTPKQWQETILQSYLKKHTPPAEELRHVLDFINQHPDFKLSSRVSYQAVRKAANDWTKRLVKQSQLVKDAGQVEVIKELKGGLTLVRLLDQTAKSWESKHMSHCVSSYTEHQGIYSIRDKDHIPHCTIEVEAWAIKQISGRANREVSEKYHEAIIEVINSLDFSFTTSEMYVSTGMVYLDEEVIDYLSEHCEPFFLHETKGSFFISTKEANNLVVKNPIAEPNSNILLLLVMFNIAPHIARELLLLTEDEKVIDEVFQCSLNLEISKLAFEKGASLELIRAEELEALGYHCAWDVVYFIQEQYQARSEEFKHLPLLLPFACEQGETEFLRRFLVGPGRISRYLKEVIDEVSRAQKWEAFSFLVNLFKESLPLLVDYPLQILILKRTILKVVSEVKSVTLAPKLSNWIDSFGPLDTLDQEIRKQALKEHQEMIHSAGSMLNSILRGLR